MKTYAGVGSRTTPLDVQADMTRLARALSARGYYLRSGGAKGADMAFIAGARASMRTVWTPTYRNISPEAYEMAKAAHPAWKNCDAYARACHARNCYQVLGETLDDPVQFVACWTPCGSETEEQTNRRTGGTRMAIIIAHRNGIPIFNLRNEGARERLREHLGMGGGA